MAAFTAASADCSAAAAAPRGGSIRDGRTRGGRTRGGRTGGRTRGAGHPAARCVRSSRAWLASEAAMLASSWARAGGARASRPACELAAAFSSASRAASVAAGGDPGARRGGDRGGGPRGGTGAGRLDEHRRQPGQVLAVLGEQRAERAGQSRRPGHSRPVPGDQRLLRADRGLAARPRPARSSAGCRALPRLCSPPPPAAPPPRPRRARCAVSGLPAPLLQSLSPGAPAERRGSRAVPAGRHPGWPPGGSRSAAGRSGRGKSQLPGEPGARTRASPPRGTVRLDRARQQHRSRTRRS